jgi:hypothetical protein
MRRRFATPCSTFRDHITAQVRGAAEGWVVGRREVACSAVSGKSLARGPCVTATRPFSSTWRSRRRMRRHSRQWVMCPGVATARGQDTLVSPLHRRRLREIRGDSHPTAVPERLVNGRDNLNNMSSLRAADPLWTVVSDGFGHVQHPAAPFDAGTRQSPTVTAVGLPHVRNRPVRRFGVRPRSVETGIWRDARPRPR